MYAKQIYFNKYLLEEQESLYKLYKVKENDLHNATPLISHHENNQIELKEKVRNYIAAYVNMFVFI